VGASGVRPFIDECLSPQLALELNASGQHDVVHPLHVGRRGEPDHRVLTWCLDEDRVIVTRNARDFRRLIGNVDIHPGLIILPSLDRRGTRRASLAAIAFLELRGDPMNVMVNHVLEINDAGDVTIATLSR